MYVLLPEPPPGLRASGQIRREFAASDGIRAWVNVALRIFDVSVAIFESMHKRAVASQRNDQDAALGIVGAAVVAGA